MQLKTILTAVLLSLGLCFCPIHGRGDVCDPVVTIEQGFVRGRALSTSDGRRYRAFKGLPYSDGPDEQLSNSELSTTDCYYDGIYTFHDSNTTCQQIPSGAEFIDGTNSLTLNIYIPESTADSTSLPVVVYMDGGGEGCVSSYMDKGTHVLVLLSFQLGSEGYIRSTEAAHPGTNGETDQHNILEWLTSNIYAFGGDPLQIGSQPLDTIICQNPTFLEMAPLKRDKQNSRSKDPTEPELQFTKGPIYTIAQGEIQGAIMSTDKGTIFSAFFGIPYAQPPLGKLRFRAPLPGLNWEGVRDGTKEQPKCLQRAINANPLVISVAGDEDCLYLTVYTPTDADGQLIAENLPVFVWIYGGAFMMGENSFNLYGPQRLLDTTNMVIVVPNYRVGALGFLSTGDDAASGNWGLLDQNMCLQWVQNNIAYFGGDPGRVTIAGESAGSASVSFHTVSPMSKGLFHGVIAESGSVLCGFAIRKNPLRYAKELAQKLFCDNMDTKKLVDCMRKKDAKEIAANGLAQKLFLLESLSAPFVPVIEPQDTGLFLTEDPLTLFQEGRYNKVPVVMGVNRDEGTVLYMIFEKQYQNIDSTFFTFTVPYALRTANYDGPNLQKVSSAVEKQYYDIDRSNQEAKVRANLDFLGDIVITAGSIQTIDQMAATDTPVYMYYFDYVGDAALSTFTGESDVAHGIELAYIFKITSFDLIGRVPTLSSRDEAFSKTLLELWTNFIVHGNPDPSGTYDWTPTPPYVHRHLEINSEPCMKEGFEEDRMRFWNTTVPQILDKRKG